MPGGRKAHIRASDPVDVDQVAGAVVVNAAQQSTMEVQVPPGATPGQVLQVVAPDGQAVQFSVPAGALRGGQTR